MALQKQQSEPYSVPEQSKQLLYSGILDHPLYSRHLPDAAREYAGKIRFTGSSDPSIPVNWRFAESVSALKALEGIMVNALLVSKYGIEPQDIEVNVDHAQLFIVSCLLTSVSAKGQEAVATKGFDAEGIFPNCDLHGAAASIYRICASNIYRTKDNRYFHLHSDLNPSVVQKALDLPADVAGDYDAVHRIYQAKCLEHTAAELDRLCNDVLRTSGTIAHTPAEYRASAHGQMNADQSLFELEHHPNPVQKPCWWPSRRGGDPAHPTSPLRPLAGLKVVDFSRIIAAPTLTRGLAEYGASVMRITSPHLPDMGFLHPDMGWGKWNCALDLRDPADRARARALIADADVVVYGYRPDALAKHGLGAADVLALVRERERGIIVAQLDCYGWLGPWAGRSGWQQISDACCGVSLEFGRAMHGDHGDGSGGGVDVNEPVTPLFPNSDHCAGLAGHIGVMAALLRRAETGGSFSVTCSLNQYNAWLVGRVGVYPAPIWRALWAKHGNPVFRHWQPMQFLWPAGVALLRRNAPHVLDEAFFEEREARAMGCTVRCVRPVLVFPGGKVRLGFQVGARTNGVDGPWWPEDLGVERVG